MKQIVNVNKNNDVCIFDLFSHLHHLFETNSELMGHGGEVVRLLEQGGVDHTHLWPMGVHDTLRLVRKRREDQSSTKCTGFDFRCVIMNNVIMVVEC